MDGTATKGLFCGLLLVRVSIASHLGRTADNCYRCTSIFSLDQVKATASVPGGGKEGEC
jgi:hypothetical protein